MLMAMETRIFVLNYCFRFLINVTSLKCLNLSEQLFEISYKVFVHSQLVIVDMSVLLFFQVLH